MEDYIDVYMNFFDEFNKSVDTTDQLPVKIIKGNLRDHDIIGCVIDWTQQYLSVRQCPSSLIAQICKYVVTEMQVYRVVDPEGCGYQKDSNVWNPLKLMQATIKKVIGVCQRHKDRNTVSKLSPPRSNMCLTVLSTKKNARRTMEDKYTIIDDLHEMLNIEGYGSGSFYGVFDGHGGAEAAMYSASRLFQCLAECTHYPTRPDLALVQAFKQTDAQYVEKAKAENLQSGTTAVVALLLQDLKQLYVAWLGDTQAIISRNEGKVSQLVSPPHRPNIDSERERIERMGGFVSQFRVQGILAVSRAIGAKDFKPYVCADPDVICLDLDGSEDFLLLATDGLWEKVTELEAASSVYTHLSEQSDTNLKSIPDALIRLSKSRGSTDNTTVLLVFLRPPHLIPAKSILPRLTMESPVAGQARYNGAAYHGPPGLRDEDFGPETDVDADPAELKMLKEERNSSQKGAVAASNENVLNLSSAGSSDSEEGEEGGGWDFVQGGQDARTLATHTSHTVTNFDSDSDDMNHPLNPDAAEFVPVTSPGLTKPNRAAPWETNHHEGVQLGNGVDKHGVDEIHGFDQIHEDKTHGDIEIHGAKDTHGADIPLGRVEHAIDDIISCSPKKPNPLKRLNDESEFFSEISKRPSGVFDLEENGVHDDTNGFEPMDISRAQATLGDSTINYMADLSSTFTSPGHTSSLSPSSPELNTNDQRRELDEFEPSEHKSELHETERHENTKYNEVKTEHHELNTDLNAFNPVEHNEFHAEHNELNIGHNELNNEHNELNTEYNAFATEHNELNTEHEFNTHNEFHAKDNELNAEQNEFASATERYETMNPFENPFDNDSTHQVAGSAFERSSDAFSNDFTNVPEENVTKNPESLHAGSVSDVVPDVTSKAEETLGEDGVSHGKADLDAFESHITTDETAKTTNETTEIIRETTSDTANSGETLDAAIAESEFTADQTKLGEFDDLETKLSHDENKEYSDLSSSQPVSVVEETLTSMMDMLVTPKPSEERRVSSDVLDAYNAVVHALDTPAGGITQPCGTPVKDEFDLKAEEELSNGLQVEEEDVANGSYIETEPHFQKDDVESHPFGHDQTHSETRDLGEVAASNNPFGDASVELHQTETDEFEFHQENNVTVDAVDRVESEANVETFIISGITPLEFLQKHAAEPVEESAKELIEDLTNEIRAEPEAQKAFADSIKEEDEEEIQIGKKVSDLNESDPMSRSFYGDFEEPARSPSPEEMIDHYERQQRKATHEVSIDQAVEQFHADNEAELTPTSEVTTLEAKLASDNHVENSVSNVDKPVSNLFEISTEETSYNEKPQEHDDLTFETKESSFQEETHTETKVESSFQETHVALETNLDDFTSQETKLDDFISAHTEKTPEVSEPKEEVLDDLVSVPTSVPDVVPNQDANEESPSPAVDLTQDIVEEKEAVVTPTDETNSETAEKETPLSKVPVIPQEAQTVESAEESTASSDLAAKVAGALVVGAAAAGAAVAVKKATAAKKTDKPGPAAKPASKPLAKTTTTKTTTAAKPAISPVKKTATTTAKPAPKPATKLAPKPTTAAPKTTTTAPKPAPVRKPVASTITKTATSTVSAAPKPSAPKPAAPKKPVAAPAPKPRPATAAPAPKPLTNGVTKRPVSATTTASRTSSSSVTSASAAKPAAKPAAPRVPLSQRTSAAKPATKPATAKPSTTSKPTTASKPATATRPATTTSKPATTTSTGVKKTSTTSSSVTRKPLSSVTSKVSSNLTVKKSPAGVKSASAIKKTETPSEPKVDSAPEAPTTNGIQEPAPLTNGVEELTTPSPILTNGH